MLNTIYIPEHILLSLVLLAQGLANKLNVHLILVHYKYLLMWN